MDDQRTIDPTKFPDGKLLICQSGHHAIYVLVDHSYIVVNVDTNTIVIKIAEEAIHDIYELAAVADDWIHGHRYCR